MIQFILLQNRQGKTRLSKYYRNFTDDEKVRREGEIPASPHPTLPHPTPPYPTLGTFTNALIQRVGMGGATIVEPSVEFSAGAEEYSHMRVVHSTLEEFAEAQGDKYDAVLLKEVVHHLGSSEKRKASLAALRSKIEPGGRLLIVTRSDEQPEMPLFEGARGVWRDNQPTAKELSSELESAGFTKVKPTEATLSYEMPLTRWCELIRQRVWSTFSHFSDAELEAGIAEIQKTVPLGDENVTIGDRLVLISASVDAIAESSPLKPTPTRNPNLTRLTARAALDMLAPITAARGSDPAFEGPRGEWWWTGVAPQACPGWSDTKKHLSSLPLLNLETCTRREVLDYFDNTWTLTEQLFSALQHEASFYMQPYHQLRHPLVFYYGHPASLYINKLRVAGVIDEGIDAHYEVLFETGVDEMSWDDLSQSSVAWPAVREVHAYRQQVYSTVRSLIESHEGLADGHAPIEQTSPLWSLVMSFEHERIHLETSSVLMREMAQPLLRRPEGWVADHPSIPRKDVLSPVAGFDYPIGKLSPVSASTTSLGKPSLWPSFGWDNEYGADSRTTPAFEASELLVSNGEMLEFVKAGGYREPRFWSEDGWGWRTFRNVKWPTFWTSVGPSGAHQYQLRTLFDLVPMPWSWPAEVNVHEAKAYAAYKSERDGRSYRLPSEAESARLRELSLPDISETSEIESSQSSSAKSAVTDVSRKKKENTFFQSLPKCRTPTFAICRRLNSPKNRKASCR